MSAHLKPAMRWAVSMFPSGTITVARANIGSGGTAYYSIGYMADSEPPRTEAEGIARDHQRYLVAKDIEAWLNGEEIPALRGGTRVNQDTTRLACGVEVQVAGPVKPVGESFNQDDHIERGLLIEALWTGRREPLSQWLR